MKDLIESEKSPKEIVDEISYAPLPDDMMAKLRSSNPEQVKKERERARREQERKERERREYLKLAKEMEKLMAEEEELQDELDELFRDMDMEAGQKQARGEEWTDDDGNRYGRMMNKVNDKIEQKRQKIADLQRKIKTKFPDLI